MHYATHNQAFVISRPWSGCGLPAYGCSTDEIGRVSWHARNLAQHIPSLIRKLFTRSIFLRELEWYGQFYSWWRHQMETYSALLALCLGNSPVNGEFPSQRPVTRSFDVFFDLCLRKQGWWLETPSCSLWRHCNIGEIYNRLLFDFNSKDIANLIKMNQNNCH